MLKVNQKNVSLTMTSVIDEKEVVTFVASFKSDGTMLPMSQHIDDNELYLANLTEVNKDLAKMQTKCFEEQAKIMQEIVDGKEE
ncbi:hypothetical protein NB814_00860 [Latilactobacillus curvatus]|uniref:hypothetical protein n=1 Tax=Latilactobacillus curvatus TaxID=28038 RepID=UPI00202FFC98|nr:hypothetical protein [Latilactobacillus curvatus]MCM0724303.1 hypothetical protein [Latilactobacillus curvatus]